MRSIAWFRGPVLILASMVFIALHFLLVDPAFADYRLAMWAQLENVNTMLAAPNGDVWAFARSRESIGGDRRLRLYRFNRRGEGRFIESPVSLRAEGLACIRILKALGPFQPRALSTKPNRSCH